METTKSEFLPQEEIKVPEQKNRLKVPKKPSSLQSKIMKSQEKNKEESDFTMAAQSQRNNYTDHSQGETSGVSGLGVSAISNAHSKSKIVGNNTQNNLFKLSISAEKTSTSKIK